MARTASANHRNISGRRHDRDLCPARLPAGRGVGRRVADSPRAIGCLFGPARGAVPLVGTDASLAQGRVASGRTLEYAQVGRTTVFNDDRGSLGGPIVVTLFLCLDVTGRISQQPTSRRGAPPQHRASSNWAHFARSYEPPPFGISSPDPENGASSPLEPIVGVSFGKFLSRPLRRGLGHSKRNMHGG